MKKAKLQARIRYAEDWNGEGEHYLFETKWSNEPESEWGLDTAFKLRDYRGPDGTVLEQDKASVIHYTALTKIREYQRMGIEFYFSSK